MVRAARAALALVLPCATHAALKTYANASTELTNLEHFFDAHLSTGLPALLGARPPVDGDVDKALKGCAKTGLALDACPALLEVLSVPRYAAHDYVARAAGLRNASQESASPLFLYGGAKDDGCTQPAHSLYAVLKGTASATGAFGSAKLDDDAKALLFVPGNDDKLTFTVSKGAAVRFCVVDASNVHSVRRLAKESPDVHFPHAKSLVISELLTALDDPEFDFVMARSYSEMPWSEFATCVARVRHHAVAAITIPAQVAAARAGREARAPTNQTPAEELRLLAVRAALELARRERDDPRTPAARDNTRRSRAVRTATLVVL